MPKCTRNPNTDSQTKSTVEAIQIVYAVLIPLFTAIILGLHIRYKAPDTDIFGNRVVVEQKFLGGGLLQKGGVCSGTSADIAKPQWFPYVWLNTALLIVLTMMYGVSRNIDFVWVSIALIFGLIGLNIYVYSYPPDGGFQMMGRMTDYLLFMESTESSVSGYAKFFAIIAYFIWWTGITRLDQINDPGMVSVIVYMILFCFTGVVSLGGIPLMSKPTTPWFEIGFGVFYLIATIALAVYVATYTPENKSDKKSEKK
jgi:hypothetical protein